MEDGRYQTWKDTSVTGVPAEVRDRIKSTVSKTQPRKPRGKKRRNSSDEEDLNEEFDEDGADAEEVVQILEILLASSSARIGEEANKTAPLRGPIPNSSDGNLDREIKEAKISKLAKDIEESEQSMREISLRMERERGDITNI